MQIGGFVYFCLRGYLQLCRARERFRQFDTSSSKRKPSVRGSPTVTRRQTKATRMDAFVPFHNITADTILRFKTCRILESLKVTSLSASRIGILHKKSLLNCVVNACCVVSSCRWCDACRGSPVTRHRGACYETPSRYSATPLPYLGREERTLQYEDMRLPGRRRQLRSSSLPPLESPQHTRISTHTMHSHLTLSLNLWTEEANVPPLYKNAITFIHTLCFHKPSNGELFYFIYYNNIACFIYFCIKWPFWCFS